MRRRSFLQAVGGSLALGACTGSFEPPVIPPPAPRLNARPRATPLTLAPGVHEVTVEGTELLAYLPASAVGRTAVPLLVFLHGASRSVGNLVTAFQPYLDAAQVMLLAPFSQGQTWDAVQGQFGPDPLGIDRAMSWAFSQVPIDAQRVVLSGFSDGASYTIGLGRANGDLFGRLVAFAPGYVINVMPVGTPTIVIAHGTRDSVLPFAFTDEIVVPSLRNLGYTVEFTEFDGEHAVLLSVAQAEIDRLGGLTA